MPSASWALQQSIFATLSADTPLLALLGGARIYDDVPQGAAFPYLTFGQSTRATGPPAARKATSTS